MMCGPGKGEDLGPCAGHASLAVARCEDVLCLKVLFALARKVTAMAEGNIVL